MSGVDAPPVAAPSPPPSPPHTAHPPTDKHHHDSSIGSEDVSGVVGRGRRKLENEDSSYDSDFEPCERPDDDEHEDVCRTVSDTLCAEYAEYVTMHSPPTTSTSTATTSTTTIVPTTHILATSLTAASSTTAAVITVTSTTAAVTTTAVTTPTATTAPVTTATTVSVTTTTAVTTSTSTPSSGCEGKTIQDAVRAASPAVRVSSAPSVSVTPPAPATTIMTIAQPLPSPSTAAKAGTVTTVTTTSSVHEPLAPVCSTSEEQTSSTTTGGVSCVVLRPSYASQVEFGVKLGYSEALVQMALVKLGGTPDKDELLAELIRLVSSVPRADGEGDSADDVTDTKDDVEHHHHHLQQQHQQPSLKPIIIDGSNVAMSHGNKTTFSCSGLRVCVDWFRARGHTEITVFVPSWRKEAPRWDTPIVDQDVLLELERERILVFTPSRVCGGKRIVSYDDRYILKEAVTSGGVVVSNDNYRDLAAESQAFRRVIEESLLMYSWVNGRFVPPDDPLGRSGPTLDVFLRRSTRDKQALCPYGRKCTYGNKCKYMHPERGTAPLKSVTERLQEQVQKHYQNKAKSRDSSPGEGLRLKSLSLPVGIAESDVTKKPLARTQSIVPSVSLTLPSALTQETPTHDLGPSTSSASSHSHHHLMPPHMDTRPLDPLRSSTMFKSDSSLYHIYSSQSTQPSYGASTWWKDQGNELPMRAMTSQQGAPPQSPSQMYGSHLSLTKQMSDPDPAASDNPHRKLQRQLTLNPAYDSRLYKIVGFREPAPEHFPLAGSGQQQQQTTGQGSPSRTMNRDNEALAFSQVASGMTGRVSPGYSSPYGSREQLPAGMHPPLARHSSQESAKHMVSLPPHLYPTYSHPHVTRFASAPDPIWGGHQQQASPGPPQITRLNSTSDTRLNVYSSSDSHFFPDVFEEQLGRLPQFQTLGPPHSVSPGPSAPSPGPIGSRPMSPQQGPVHHHSPSVSPRQQPVGFSSNFSNPTSHEDARLHVFYHLSNLFPEAQVRAVLAMYPEETDPQKICSYILSCNPGPVGSRPMSPQQLSQSGVGHQSQGAPVCGSSPLSAGFSSSLPTAASSHEDARLRIFYNLSQLFPVAQVRAVLARYPEETDAKQLCATLLSHLSGNQS
ncbi:probable ribonuclease ZC3H12C isoform X2 [Procambarus clarkii]|nr:probable ribonuclease ZC3H12C isoform X2 [Procambarus clarkii]XP_045600249.1 probable ribonuclease ZC3H12C isoform X2 [Procambarus clarkii]